MSINPIDDGDKMSPTKVKKLPAPRLQLRWCKSNRKPEYQWECHYELVLPLSKYDIRREWYKRGELVVPIKEPSLRGGDGPPCTYFGDKEKKLYADTPFRDGAHARWVAKELGNPPIYVISPDGVALKLEDK